MASNGERGAKFERDCRGALISHGYEVVRSTRSRTRMDLVALRTWTRADTVESLESWATQEAGLGLGRPLLVQAKLDGRLDPAEWNGLFDLACTSGATAVLARREREGRRLVPVFYRLTGRRVPRSRTWPMVKIAFPPVPTTEERS